MPQHRLSRIISGTRTRGTIVALHGVTDSAASLSDIASHWKHEWEVICLDSLGHGLSPEFSDDELHSPFDALSAYALTEIAQAVRNSGAPVVIYGHSLGGAIATTIARRYPELVRALILDDPALLTDEQIALYASSAQQLAERQDLVSAHVGDAIVELMKSYPNWPPAEYGPWAQGKVLVDRAFVRTGIVGTPRADLLDSLTVPTLLVTGDADDVLIGQEGLSAIQNNPHIHGVLIPHATHTVRRDQPATFYERADSFLDSLPPIERPDAYIVDELAHVPGATPPQTTWDVPALRERGDKLLGDPFPDDPEIIRETIEWNGVPMCVNRPAEGEIRAAVLSIHGGGFIAGRARFDDERNSALSKLVGSALVVSPDYRLAPEHPFPAGVEDCLAAWDYLAQEAPGVPIIIYGDSAGAGLSQQIIQATARAGVQRRLDAVIAIEPCIDPEMYALSYTTCKDGPLWTAEAAKYAWAHYLGKNTHPYEVYGAASIVRDIMPPTLVVVNPTDPLRDEGIGWATSLADASIPVELHMLPGTIHGTPATIGTRTWDNLCTLISTFLTPLTATGDNN
ncbi:alpha/beta fold hydrolase [Arcanobacterium haemolyticum]|nr:alpha/beta fold hydrolase [Arcanobacterium haemolyticum]